jgi:hypothetical protein
MRTEPERRRQVLTIAVLIVFAVQLTSCTAIMKDSRLSVSSLAEEAEKEEGDLESREGVSRQDQPANLALTVDDVSVHIQVLGANKSCITLGPLYIMIIPCGLIKPMGMPWEPDSLTVHLSFSPSVVLDASRVEIWIPSEEIPLFPSHVESITDGNKEPGRPTSFVSLVYPVRNKKIRECELHLPPVEHEGRDVTIPPFLISKVSNTYVDLGID